MAMRPRRFIRTAAVVAGAVALASCSVSSGDDEASTDDETDDTPAVTTDAPTHGVTDDAIKVGIAMIDAEAVREQFGVELGQLPPEALTALITAVNEDGGINGRQLDVVTRPFMPIGTEDSERVCRELTEDEQVFAVAGTFLNDNPLCITETYETPYIALWGLNDERRERSVAPFIAMEAGVEQRLGASVQGMIEDGLLDGRKVAVYHESDSTPALIDEVVTSPLEDAGIEVVSTGQLPGSGDAVQAASDIDLIFQRFEADGADAVIAAGGAGVFLPALERTSWAPQLVFTNGQVLGDGSLQNYGLTAPAELEGAAAMVPGLTTDELVEDETLQACIATINEGSDLAVTDDDFYTAEERPGSREFGQIATLCQLWDLTVAVLTAAGDDPSPQSLIDGLAELDAFDLAGYPGMSLSPEQWGAQGDLTRMWTYDAETVRFVPDGPVTGG